MCFRCHGVGCEECNVKDGKTSELLIAFEKFFKNRYAATLISHPVIHKNADKIRVLGKRKTGSGYDLFIEFTFCYQWKNYSQHDGSVVLDFKELDVREYYAIEEEKEIRDGLIWEPLEEKKISDQEMQSAFIMNCCNPVMSLLTAPRMSGSPIKNTRYFEIVRRDVNDPSKIMFEKWTVRYDPSNDKFSFHQNIRKVFDKNPVYSDK